MRYWLIAIGFVLSGTTWADEPNQFRIGKTQQLVFLPDGKAVLGRCDNRCIILYDLNGRALAGDNSVSGYLQHIAVDPTGRWAASAELAVNVLPPAADGKKVEEVPAKQQPQIRIWSLPDLKLQHTIALDGADGIAGLAFSPDGKMLASVRGAGDVRLWDVTTGRRKHAWSGGKHAIQSVHFSAEGDKLLCAGTVEQIVQGSVNFWASDRLVIRDAATGKRVETLDMSADYVEMSADRRWMYTQNYWYAKGPARKGEGELQVNGAMFAQHGGSAVLDRFTGRTTFQFDSWLGPVSVAGPFLAYWLQDPEYSMSSEVVERFVGPKVPWEHLRVMELRTGQDCWRRKAPGVTAFALSRDGRHLAGANETGKIELIDLYEPQTSPKLYAGPDALAAAWRDLAAPDASRLIAAWHTLRADHAATLRLLRKELSPAKLDEKLLALRLDDLNDLAFAVRAKAAGELLKMDAEGWLRKAQSKPLSAEQRQVIEQLLAKFATRPLTLEQRQQARALDLLSQLPQSESSALLRELARGAPDSWLTREAVHALQRKP
jgi:Anaphase-promoting complex subunit 4 WD40 domain